MLIEHLGYIAVWLTVITSIIGLVSYLIYSICSIVDPTKETLPIKVENTLYIISDISFLISLIFGTIFFYSTSTYLYFLDKLNWRYVMFEKDNKIAMLFCPTCKIPMLQCQYYGGGIYWTCGKCGCKVESTGL